MYRSHQVYRQTTIQIPQFIHILNKHHGQKNQCINCKTFSFGQIRKMSSKVCTCCTERYRENKQKESNANTQHGDVSLPKRNLSNKAFGRFKELLKCTGLSNDLLFFNFYLSVSAVKIKMTPPTPSNKPTTHVIAFGM